MISICKICNTTQDLRTHLKVHNITAKEYYDHYLKKSDSEGICPVCGKKTKFLGISQGYRIWCSNKCHQNDPAATVKRVAAYKNSGCGNVTRKMTWANKTSIEKRIITDKVKSSIKSKYGTDSYSQTEQWKSTTPQKISETNKSYGNDFWKKNHLMGLKKYCTSNNIEYTDDITNVFQLENIKKIIHEKYTDYLENNRGILKEIRNKRIADKYSNYIKIIDFKYDEHNHCICECNSCHRIFSIHYQSMRERILNKRPVCFYCNPRNNIISRGEKELSEFIREIYLGRIIENCRSVLGGREIDIFLPDLNMAFEYDGTYWHMDPRFYKPEDILTQKNVTAEEIWKRDLEKNQLCESHGICLIRVKEYDWINDNNNIKKHIFEQIYNINLRNCPDYLKKRG